MVSDNINSVSTIRNANLLEDSIRDFSDATNVSQVNQQSESGSNQKASALNNEKLSEKTIKEVIDNTNKKLVATDRKFEFSINEETEDIIVKVINKETDEVIREIPSEKILDMVAKMMELAGLFIDEKR
ncbi:flagellar protein FlaG [Wukongibacter baidiensis]|uniref:flagellar protein FlaG n=1 Tax=Wukongibacter baidiensis TaxID=1723361 RepID=UPI003D7F38AE